MEEMTVASAVIVPEPSEVAPSSPTLKRRQSSIDSTESKRPRLGADQSQDSRSPPPNGADGKDRRRSGVKGNGAIEERKRGRRLFGAILGTLSQSSSSAGQRKRAEIEKKQLDKLKQRHEKDEERKKKRKEELLVIRKREQKLWEEQGLRLRHRNMLAMAHFLKTKTEPPLYYKPWELQSEEEDLIQQQISEAQETIDRELVEFEEKRRRQDEEEAALAAAETEKQTQDSNNPEAKSREPENPKDHDAMDEGLDGTSEKKGVDPPAKSETGGEDQDSTMQEDEQQQQQTPAQQQPQAEENTAATAPDITNGHDHGGEELVEGQEDDVIY